MGSRDFTYNLILKQDKESWAGGARSVDKLANNVSRLIGTAQAAAAAYAALKGVVEGSKLASESAMLSDSLGVSVKRLEDWKVAAKIAGVSSSELTKSMGALDRKFTEWKNRGKADTGMAVALGQLGLNASDMFDMSADERARVILQAASTMKDTKNAAALVSQLLGGAGEQMYHFMRLSNTSVDRLLERSRRFSLVDDGVAKNGFAFTTELNTTIAALQQLGTFTGAAFGKNLTGFLQDVNKFFSANGDSIAKKITGFSDSLAKIASALRPFMEGALKVAINSLLELTNAIAALLNGNPGEAAENIKNIFSAVRDGLLGSNGDESAKKIAAFKTAGSKLDSALRKNESYSDYFARLKGNGKQKNFSDLSSELQAQVTAYITMGKEAGVSNDIIKKLLSPYITETTIPINDGIIRPDGRITQVAPDDWVFAARNIGDLAKMFVPQSASTTTYGGSSYTINQTLNIQGAPFAQAAKRAAYEGTSQALRSVSDSSQRLQLMPGLR